MAAFAGDDAAMADYLLSEVLAQQPDELVDFLLRTSVVDVVCGELADALTGGARSDEVLARLEREHALVSAHGDQRTWHRYHPLMRELLRSELRFRMPEAGARAAPPRRRVVRRARRQPVEALRHAAQAGDWDTVAELAGAPLGAAARPGRAEHAAHRAREPARPPRRQDDPEIALALSAVLLDQGDEPRRRRAVRAGQGARATQVPEERRLAFDLGRRGGRARAGAPARRRRASPCRRAQPPRRAAGGRRRAARGGAMDLRALALINLGIAELWTGELDAARRDLEAGRRAGGGNGRDWLVLLAATHLAAHAVFVGPARAGAPARRARR